MWLRDRAGLILSLLATLAAATVLVAAQPVRSHWWIYDNADPSYAAAGLELVAGLPIKFVDHPGLPLTQLTGIVFGLDYLLATRDLTRVQYANSLLLDLDSARLIYRGVAVVLYLLGALAAFVIVARVLGHQTWGFAGAAAWLGAPGLAPLSIQARPDVPLAALILLFAYLLARAARDHSTGHALGAAAVAGFCVLLKLHAIGLVVPLALLVLVRPPPPGWWPAFRADAARFVQARRRALVAAAVVLLVLAVLFNAERVPFDPTGEQLVSTAVAILVVADCLLLAWFLRTLWTPAARRLAYAGAIGTAFLAGAALPVLLMLPEGLQAVANIGDALRGRGITEGAEPVSVPFSRLLDDDLEVAFIVFVFAGVAAARGLLQRDFVPALWFSGAAVLGLMAQSRLGSVHYYIPAFMLAMPGMLWLISSAGRRRPSLLVWLLLLVIVYPSFRDRDAAAAEAERLVQTAAPSLSMLEGRLAAGEVAFTPSAWPHPDTRYFELVHRYTYAGPTYPYRFLPGAADAAALAMDRGLRFRYYTGPAIFHVSGEADVELEGLGTYRVRRLPDVPLAVELLAGPGVTPP
jgi:hypothetical protein